MRIVRALCGMLLRVSTRAPAACHSATNEDSRQFRKALHACTHVTHAHEAAHGRCGFKQVRFTLVGAREGRGAHIPAGQPQPSHGRSPTRAHTPRSGVCRRSGASCAVAAGRVGGWVRVVGKGGVGWPPRGNLQRAVVAAPPIPLCAVQQARSCGTVGCVCVWHCAVRRLARPPLCEPPACGGRAGPRGPAERGRGQPRVG